MALPDNEPPRRVVRLKLIGGGTVELDDVVPMTRAECPTTRPCGHVRCKQHLAYVAGHDRRGRPPVGREQESTLRPFWMDWPVGPTCALDVAERSANMNQDEVAAAIGLRRSQFRELVAQTIRKLKASGLSLDDLAPDVG